MRKYCLAIAILFGAGVFFLSCAFGADSSRLSPSAEDLSKKIRIHGSASLEEMFHKLSRLFRTLHPSYQTEIKMAGSIAGLEALKNKRCDIAVSSVEIQNSLFSEFAEKTESIPLFESYYCVMVHPDNPLSEIDSGTLRKIYSGAIVSWKSLGGASKKIIPVFLESGTGIAYVFNRTIMAQTPLRKDLLMEFSEQAAIQDVAHSPEAIGFLLATKVQPDIKTLSLDGIPCPSASAQKSETSYPLKAPLYLYYRKPADTKIKLFLESLFSEEGQHFLNEEIMSGKPEAKS